MLKTKWKVVLKEHYYNRKDCEEERKETIKFRTNSKIEAEQFVDNHRYLEYDDSDFDGYDYINRSRLEIVRV